MKLKQQPEDFSVEELTDFATASTGPFAFYRLEKTGWTTPDAVLAIRRRWQLDARRVSFGGLKDRHAHTIQFFTVFRGPQRKLTHSGIAVEYLGQAARAYGSHDIRANRFRLILRAIETEELAQAEAALEAVRREGVPNYFDDQRFGSVEKSGEFVARLMVKGHYEDALRLALVGPYEFDRAPQKKEKAILRAHWGDWSACRRELARGPARRPLDYLVSHSTDFRGALAQLPPDLRWLYLSAYQSHLWNRMLARWLADHLPPEQLIPIRLKLETAPMHRDVRSESLALLRDLTLPLPTARFHPDPADPRTALMEQILRKEGLELPQLKLRGFREMFFSKGERAALCMPRELIWQSDADELHPDRRRLVLAFELPPGSYATLIVKRIMTGSAIGSAP